MKKISTLIKEFVHHMGTLFLNGLLTILPITITVTLFTFSFRTIVSWLEPLHNLITPTFMGRIPYAGVVTALLIILATGVVLHFFVLQPIIHLAENLFFKIPLVRPIYMGIKQLTQAFGFKDKMSFKKIVLLEFPRPGIYSLGFLTSELPQTIAPRRDEKYYTIFIPTTPNPTTGFLVILPEREFKTVDLSRQEAMALIISGGIVRPERFEEDLNKES